MIFRRGLTLVEMMLASAVMAVLAMMLLSVMGHLVRVDRQLAKRSVPDLEVVRELIEADRRVATSIELSESGDTLRFSGHGRIDPADFRRTGESTVVEYAVVDEEKGGILVRREQRTEQRRIDKSSALVAFDVARFGIEQPAAGTGNGQAGAPRSLILEFRDGRKLRFGLPEATP